MMRKLTWLLVIVAVLFVPLRADANGDDGNLYNGYYWHDQNWVPGLITVDTWFTPTPRYASGRAVFYGPEVMQGTARWRGMSLDGYLDGIAMMSPADIGATVWLRRPGHDWEGPYLVVDSAARHDMYSVVLHRKEIIEVGFRTAQRWDMVRGDSNSWSTVQWAVDGVEVLKSETLPAWASPEDSGLSFLKGYLAGVYAVPWSYPDWFADQIQFSSQWEPRPYYVRPGLWDMRDGDPPKAWHEFDIEPPLFTSRPSSG